MKILKILCAVSQITTNCSDSDEKVICTLRAVRTFPMNKAYLEKDIDISLVPNSEDHKFMVYLMLKNKQFEMTITIDENQNA